MYGPFAKKATGYCPRTRTMPSIYSPPKPAFSWPNCWLCWATCSMPKCVREFAMKLNAASLTHICGFTARSGGTTAVLTGTASAIVRWQPHFCCWSRSRAVRLTPCNWRWPGCGSFWTLPLPRTAVPPRAWATGTMAWSILWPCLKCCGPVPAGLSTCSTQIIYATLRLFLQKCCCPAPVLPPSLIVMKLSILSQASSPAWPSERVRYLYRS